MNPTQRSQERHVLELLSSLSYRTGELPTYLQQIASGVSQLIGVDWSIITLYESGVGQIVGSNIELPDEELSPYETHGTIASNVFSTGKAFIVEDVSCNPGCGMIDFGYQAYLGVPLRSPQGMIMGTVCSLHRNPRQFTAEEVGIVELLAERAATAIDNYNLYQQQRRFNEILEAEVVRRTEELEIAQIKLVEQERLVAIGEFAATIVHEIRNPLMTMSLGLNYFKRVAQSSAAQERLTLALSEADRLERLLREILLYAKPQILQREMLELNQWMTELFVELNEQVKASNRQLKLVTATQPLMIYGDRDKLKQVLINLIHNASDAIAQDKIITWSVVPTATEYVSIYIHNSGEPIPPTILPRLFEPFFTTKSTGTGLGLSIVKRIVEAHGGQLSIESSVEQGTVARVELPLAVY
jgi:signal transduction histidine kinase